MPSTFQKAVDDGQTGPEVNGCFNEEAKHLRMLGIKVFFGEDDHGVVEDKHVVQTPLFGALPFVVNDPGVRVVMILITSKNDSPTQIDVFTIHKEGLIEETNFI